MNDIEAEIMMLVQNNGKCPIKEWRGNIRDKTTLSRIDRQIDKLAFGLGVQKGLQGVSELKIDVGPGYRVYYAYLDNKTLVVLIGGGDKSSQSSDIKNARDLWASFERGGQPRAALHLWKEEPRQKDEPNDTHTF